MAGARIDSIANYLSGLGDPERDSGASSRPVRAYSLSDEELGWLYLQDDLAAIIVDELVEEALRGGFLIQGADDADPLLIDELYRVEALTKIENAAKDSRLWGESFLWLIVADGRALDQPLGPGEVVQLVELTARDLRVHAVQKDPLEAGWNEPVLYKLSQKDVIHASRLLRFVGERVPKRLDARGVSSVLQRPWNAVRRFSDVENATARIVQSFEQVVVSIGGLAQAQAQGHGDLVEARMKMLAVGRSILNTILLDADAGESYTRDTASVAGLPEILDRFALSVAKAARMPMTKLFGQAPSGLNTDGASGENTWNKRVATYRERELTPQIDRLCEALFKQAGGEPESWAVVWPPLDEPSLREMAETRKIVAETDAIYLDRGVRSPDQVARSRDGAAEWTMETEAPEDDVDFEKMQEVLRGIAIPEDD